ncbi:HET-domain-containing protein, partial [Lojkania enalia]
LPLRVLDVNHDSPSGVALFETQGLSAPYACLSHCWGGHQPLTTIRANIEEHKKAIHWTCLPKTFQDAIIFVRRLLIRYLWIDSLCITQDDAQDWTIQSAQMASIYRNSSITLSAAWAAGPHDGLFIQKPPRTHSQTTDPGPNKRKQAPHLPSRHPLLSRAWAHQERLLSPRVLHFGHELLWECMTHSTCECGSAAHDNVRSSLFTNWPLRKTFFHPLAFSLFSRVDIANVWQGIVRDYTRLQLSNASDIFPALSGAAKLLRAALEEKGVRSGYVAGLWEDWFVEDCLW